MLFQYFYIIIRRCIYIFLFALDKLLGNRSQLIILCYHSVSSDPWRFAIDPKAIQLHIKYLTKNYQPLSLSQVQLYLEGKTNLSKPGFVITFDDGYEDITQTCDLFKKNSVKPTVFVLSNPDQADRRILKTQKPLLSFIQIKQLKKKGWEIGCHTATHMILINRNLKDLRRQIVQSKKILEKKFGFAINYFSYPYGRYSRQVVEVVRAAQFKLALSMDAAPVTPLSNRLALPRIGVDRTHNYLEFQALTSPSVIRFRQFVKNTPFGIWL